MSVYDITHGAGGIWECHQWNGGVVLNEEAGTLPRYFVQRLTGFGTLPDANDPRAPRVARIGENAYPTNALGITRGYEGEIIAASVPSLRLARTALVAAFADRRSEGFMDILPQAGDDSPTARFSGKPIQLEIADEVVKDKGLFFRSYTLGLRCSDPRFYYSDLAVDVSGNPAAVTNPGDAPVDPVITITSAADDVTVTDGTHTLTFRNVPSGDLVIDFAARTAKVGATNCELVVANSDWWDRFIDGIAGGDSVSISQTGGTGVRVQFTPATWG